MDEYHVTLRQMKHGFTVTEDEAIGAADDLLCGHLHDKTVWPIIVVSYNTRFICIGLVHEEEKPAVVAVPHRCAAQLQELNIPACVCILPHGSQEPNPCHAQGVILYGEPGTGKTLLAKAVANSTSATFLRVVGSELIQKYLGDGPKLVRELFRVADDLAPSIVFIGAAYMFSRAADACIAVMRGNIQPFCH